MIHLLGAAGPNIPVGQHLSAGGVNFDTAYDTVIAAGVVIVLGVLLRRRATAGVPGKLQLAWESIADAIGNQVEQALGPQYRSAVPFALTIFVLVLAADWIEILPGLYRGKDYLPSPSADVNFCYALGLTVWVVTNFAGIRANGFWPWLKNFLSPIHAIEHVTRWLTLALRLFGNIFAGSIMIALLLSFPVYFAPATIALSAIWKLFDLFIGLIQAFIFALLTILYWQFNVELH